MQPQTQSQPDSSGRLVYAAARDPSSLSSAGLRNDNAAASIAASKGWSSQKPQHHHSQQPQQKQLSPEYSRTPARPASAPANPTSLKAATTAASAASAALSALPPARSELPKMVIPPQTFASLPTTIQQQPQQPQQSTPQLLFSSQFNSQFTSQYSSQQVPVVVEPPVTTASTSTKPNSNASTAASLAAGSAAAASRHQRSISGESAVSLSSPSMVSSSTWGSSAANFAYKNRNSGSSTVSTSTYAGQPSPEKVALSRQPSLRAAKGAMRAAAADNAAGGRATRSRAISTPVAYRHQKSYSSSQYTDVAVTPATTNTGSSTASQGTSDALSAATMAHGPVSGRDRNSFTSDSGSVPYTNMNRQMYTSRPPVHAELEEQNHNDGLHASAVAMAKRMYNPKSGKSLIGPSSNSSNGGPYSTSLQEAAYKLAQERLEKLQQEHQRDRGYRDHYMDPSLLASSSAAAATNAAASSAAGQPTTRRSAVRARLRRRRSASDSEVVEDRKRSLEIRNQMSLLTNRISEVDQEKRRKDRTALLAAAQRNVRAQLEDIDEQVYNETGKVQPSRLANWEHKAHLAAQTRLDSRRAVAPPSNHIDIGGGRFMHRDEVDKIAARRVQPLLDDINEKAEKERERVAALRQEEEERKLEAEAAKQRDRETKLLNQKLKQDEKQGRREAKKKRALQISIGKGNTPATDEVPDEDQSALASPTSPQPPASPRPSTPPAKEQTGPSNTGLAKLFALSPKIITRNRGASSGSAAAAPVASSSTATAADEAGDSASEQAADSVSKESVDSAPENTGEPVSKLSADSLPEQADDTTPKKSGDAAPEQPGDSAPDQVAAGRTTPLSPQSPVSDEFPSTSPTSRVRNWLKTRFAVRPRAKSAASAGSWGENSTAGTEKSFIGGHALTSVEGNSSGAEPTRRVPGFIGGAALTGGIATGSATSLGNRSTSMRDVALAGRQRSATGSDIGAVNMDGPDGTAGLRGSNRNSQASSIMMARTATNGTSDDQDQFVEAYERFSDRGSSSINVSLTSGTNGLYAATPRSSSLSPPRGIRDPATKKSPSPARDSRFHENLEES